MPLIQSWSPGQFCWAELVAHDMPSAVEFYKRVLGWSVADLNTACDDSLPHVQFEAQGQPVAGLLQLSGPLRAAGLPSVWNTYVSVDSVGTAVDRAVRLGGTVTCPVTNAGEHGLVAFVQDPTGGVIGLWERGSHTAEALRGEVSSVCWNELATHDAAAAREFYAGLFGWTYADSAVAPEAYSVVKSANGEQIGGIMQMNDDWGDMPSHWTIYLQVDAVDAVVVSVQQLHGRMVVPPFDTPVGRIAVVADNQGAAFNVICPVPAGLSATN